MLLPLLLLLLLLNCHEELLRLRLRLGLRNRKKSPAGNSDRKGWFERCWVVCNIARGVKGRLQAKEVQQRAFNREHSIEMRQSTGFRESLQLVAWESSFKGFFRDELVMNAATEGSGKAGVPVLQGVQGAAGFPQSAEQVKGKALESCCKK